MGSAEEITIFNILIFGIFGMFGLALAIVLFFLTYQKRLLRQQHAAQEADRRYQQDLLRATLQSQEQERRRIGGDLHDEVGALITTSKLYFGQLTHDLEGTQQRELQQKMRSIYDEMLSSVRRISHDLKPAVLDSLGLVAALEAQADKLNETGDVEVTIESQLTQDLPVEVETALYRMSQELLQNTLKHAGASHISFYIAEDYEYIQFRYEDNGKGLGTEAAPGLGLKNIQSRALAIGGKVQFPPVQSGFTLLINIPQSDQSKT